MIYKKSIPLFLFVVLFSLNNVISQDTGSDHEKWEFILVDTGDILQLAIPLSAGFIALVEADYDGATQLAYAYGLTMAITYSGKYLIRKQRPEGRNRFDSFPSGHTSSAFSGASFIQRRYGWKYGWIAYTLASVVAISRMEGPNGYHDIWDVLAGASVGIGSTYVFTSKKGKDPLRLSFATTGNKYLIGFQIQF